MDVRLASLALLLLVLVPGASLASDKAVTLKVDNMSCVSCPLIVKDSLAKVPGVKSVEVSYPKKSAVVIYDEARTTPSALIDAATKAGFPSHAAE